MISALLFLVIFKLIQAPTWCFVIAWILLICKSIELLFSFYKIGKKVGKEDG